MFNPIRTHIVFPTIRATGGGDKWLPSLVNKYTRGKEMWAHQILIGKVTRYYYFEMGGGKVKLGIPCTNNAIYYVLVNTSGYGKREEGQIDRTKLVPN